jgi:arginine decarboxylase
MLPSTSFMAAYHAMGKNRARPKEAVVYATQSIAQAARRHQSGFAGAGAGLAAGRRLDRNALQRGVPDAHLHIAAVRHHRKLRCGRSHDGAAPVAPPWWRRASRKRWTSAAPCARWPRNTVATGGSRSGVRTRSRPTTGVGQAVRLGAQGQRKVARLRQPRADGSTCWTRSSPPSSPRVWTCRASSLKHRSSRQSIVTKYLAEHGVVVEKTGLYSVLHHVHHRHHQGPLEHAC